MDRRRRLRVADEHDAKAALNRLADRWQLDYCPDPSGIHPCEIGDPYCDCNAPGDFCCEADDPLEPLTE